MCLSFLSPFFWVRNPLSFELPCDTYYAISHWLLSRFLSLFLVFRSFLWLWCIFMWTLGLFYLGFSQLREFLGVCLSPSLGSFQLFFLQIMFQFHSHLSLFLWFQLYECWYFCYYPTDHETLGFGFFLFSCFLFLCFWSGERRGCFLFAVQMG